MDRYEVRVADTVEDVRRCWPVFRQLRENIPTEEEFLRRWRVQADEGYRVVYVEQDGEVRAVGGYRYLNNMAWGRILYLDDLAALTERQGSGLGSAILEHVQEQARVHGCDAVHLDTGHHRRRAHKAYLRNGFEISAHHLEWKVVGG